MTDDVEVTQATTLYPAEAVSVATGRISSQGLWLLLSLDQYGWRVEHDAIRVVLAARIEGHGHFEEHAPLVATGHLFALIDKLWRLLYGIRAHRAGREFLNTEDGYLTAGYKLEKKLKQLEAITADEWRELLGIPAADVIRSQMVSQAATDDEITLRVGFAKDLPRLIETNMHEIQGFFAKQDAAGGPAPKTYSLRELESRHRHGAPVVYHDCSPTDAAWVAVDRRQDGDHRGDTIGLVLLPPDASGAAFIGLFKHDVGMREALIKTSETLAVLVRRLARAHLLALAPGLIDDPLAAVADYSA